MELEEILREHGPFVENLQIGDKVLIEVEGFYREGTVNSEIYVAPSENRYIDVKVGETVYAVPCWEVYPLGSKEVIYPAYIYSKNYHGKDFSGRGTYYLEFDKKEIRKVECCTGRKDANKKLLADENFLKGYGINRVWSNGTLIYKN